ncbi:hypothetical protein C2R22_04965 [Salinigranum rubrum]|uniref:t-SNARE coiled-coil homology domain-containing protein n=1 Tax=Salinigranum rubrum TaxID=755307 RepID=A0A2I8VJ58_9EURY|nr:hypothetical protein C2R22_04965 [Salinigranum rubrum]
MDKRITRMESKMGLRFDKVDCRFDQLEGKIGSRFDEIDNRFDQLDDNIASLRTEMNTRFTKCERRVRRDMMLLLIAFSVVAALLEYFV